MDNPNITYADGWKNAENPAEYIPAEVFSESDDLTKRKNKKPRKKAEAKPILSFVQLILCLLIVLGAYIIKMFGGELYDSVHNWYRYNLDNEIVMTDNFKDFNLNNIFNGTKNP